MLFSPTVSSMLIFRFLTGCLPLSRSTPCFVSLVLLVFVGPGLLELVTAVTESDRLKARAKAMMQQRTAALTGKKVDPVGAEDTEGPERLEAETIRVKNEREGNEHL